MNGNTTGTYSPTMASALAYIQVQVVMTTSYQGLQTGSCLITLLLTVVSGDDIVDDRVGNTDSCLMQPNCALLAYNEVVGTMCKVPVTIPDVETPYIKGRAVSMDTVCTAGGRLPMGGLEVADDVTCPGNVTVCTAAGGIWTWSGCCSPLMWLVADSGAATWWDTVTRRSIHVARCSISRMRTSGSRPSMVLR